MNSPSKPPRRWRRILRTFALIMAVSFGLLGWCICDVVTLSREADGLKKTFFSACVAPPKTVIQFSAGPWLLLIARLVTRQINDLPREARLALHCVHSASVGVYKIDRSGPVDPTAVILSDKQMRLRGWRRAVGVRDGSNTVLIYTPERELNEDLKVCVAVLNGSDLVLVSGTIDGHDLCRLVSDQIAQKSGTARSVEQI